MIPPRTTKPVTHHIPDHLYEAFLQNATAFLQNARTGDTAAQRAIEVRLKDRDAGLDSLAYLLRLTLGTSGQCGIVARFLAGLYNGNDFPFNLTELRGLDADLFEHCVATLRLDNEPTVEIHKYIPDGEKVFLKLLQDWDLVKRPAPPPPAADWYNVKYDSYGNAPGYRNYSMFVRLALKNGQPGQSERIELNFNAEDSAQIAQDIMEIHRFAWDQSSRGMPIDLKPSEHRPHWLPK
jgi:hypothetical protein